MTTPTEGKYAMMEANCGTKPQRDSKPPIGLEPMTCGLQSRPAGFFYIAFLKEYAFFCP